MTVSEVIKKLQEIQKEHSCELDAINSLGDEIVEVRWLAFSSSVVFMTDEDLWYGIQERYKNKEPNPS